MSGPRRRKFVGPIVSRVTWHGGRGTPYLRRWALIIALAEVEAGVEETGQALARGGRLLGLLPDALEVERSVQREVAEGEVDVPHPHPRPGEAKRTDEQDGIDHPETEQRATRDREAEPGRPESGV